jgi:N-methylhydantoinase B
VALDPITYQVILSRLSGIVQEMQDGVFRTGYSTIVRESQDASCMLLDPQGRVIGEHVILPLHVASMAAVVRAIRATYPDDIAPGDAFISNHPYLAGLPHSMDMSAITPVFCGTRLIAFCGSIAHKSDLGGVVPGTSYGNARELFQEGIQYPPVRYMRAGEVVRDIEAILAANSRTPDLVLGDLRGQIGSARLGERRIADLVARYGVDAVVEAFEQKQVVTERTVRRALAQWPDGVHEGEATLDNDGISAERSVRVHVRVEKRGDRISFDFSGCDDQAAGPINIGPDLTRGCVYYALIATIDPSIPNDGGLARSVETTFRSGSLVDPIFPAARSAYTPTTNAVTEATLAALSGFAPHTRAARNGGSGGFSIAGRRPDGSAFNQYEMLGSAEGGIVEKDGLSGVTVLLGNSRSASIEVLECEFPTRLRRFELIRDSGGAGEFRGGNGPRREYEILTHEGQLALRGGLHLNPASGEAGGRPARLGSMIVNPASADERVLPNRFAGVPLRYGDIVRLEKSGGGGLGDPRKRPFAAIVDDVLDGFISIEAAIDDYGVTREHFATALSALGFSLDDVAR